MAAEAVVADLDGEGPANSRGGSLPSGRHPGDGAAQLAGAMGTTVGAEVTPRSARSRGTRASPSPSSEGSRSRSPDAG
eukprot:14531431-Alexandrium_andersonii.AAC.1